jgi:hypothetical protein
MTSLNLAKLHPKASERIQPFFEQILSGHQVKIHSLIVTGSAITEDFDSHKSDVNSLIVLKEMDLKFLEAIAPLGKKHGKQKVAAPLIMTPEYIAGSLDVFPIEFLNFKLIHLTAFGEEILDNIEIHSQNLRHQCEWEIKTKLIGLRQGYLGAQADRRLLSENFGSIITGSIPLFRGIIFLLENETPIQQNEVIKALSDSVAIDTSVFSTALKVKQKIIKPSIDEFNEIFENYYAALEKLERIIDEIAV